jgi:hypothetical protein
MAEYRRLKDQMARAANDARADSDASTFASRRVLRELGESVSTLLTFDANERPEVWRLSLEQASMTRESPEGERTTYSFDDVAAVEVIPEVVGEDRGSDSDTEYFYRYSVYLVLASGERFRLRQCKSSEGRKTDHSEAFRDSRWLGGYLREMFGLPAE